MPSSEESIAVHPLTTYSTSHVTTSTDRVTTTAGHVTVSQCSGCSNSQKYRENELLRLSGTLVRKNLKDPHTPIWLKGYHYPAQYLTRQTRSMTALQQQDRSVRSNRREYTFSGHLHTSGISNSSANSSPPYTL